jgi:Na+-translocating ferredoxin:NAD+ oxidoreductase subunit B
MDWSLIWKAAIALAGFGALLGAILAISYRRFYVEIDPRVEEVLSALPRSNCGACGMPGCEPAAEAIVKGEAPVDLCKAGGPEVAAEVARIMGIEFEPEVPVKAHIHCRGGASLSPIRAIYQGVNSCRAAQTAVGGGKACPFGCLGLEDCARVCPVNAITFDEEGIQRVNVKKCTGCGLCADVCPRDLIELVPVTARVFARCKCQYTGKKALSVCQVACIGCKRCEKVCPEDAIHVDNGFATIDYTKCTGCGECAMVCPTDTIQIWVPDEDHPEGGEFVIPEGKKKRGAAADEKQPAGEAG